MATSTANTQDITKRLLKEELKIFGVMSKEIPH